MNIEAQQSPILSDFTYGELSPRMLGRVETAVYHKGAQAMQNFVPMIQGGFRKRTGGLQLGNIYNNNPYVRLHGMVISGSLWYLLEFSAATGGGTATLRIWGNMLTTPSVVQTISTPYLGSELAALQFGWAYPNKFIAHGNHLPAMLQYVSLNTFNYIAPIPMVGSSAAYLTGITLTSGNAYFPITSQQLINLPSTVMLPVTLTANGTTALTVVSPNPLNNYWSVVGKYIFITGDSVARQITAATSTTLTLGTATSVTGTSLACYIANTGLPISAAATVSSVWTSVLPAGCYLQSITTSQMKISSAPTSSPTGVVAAISQDIIPVQNNPGTPNLPFQGVGNYPSVVTCANQRVIWLASNNSPQEVWSSVVGIWDNYGNMEMQFFELVGYTVQQMSVNSAGQPLDANGNVVTAALQNTPAYVNISQIEEVIGDADGFDGQVYSDQNDSIQWCVAAVDIIMGTLSGQIEIDGNATANTFAFRNISRTGCASIQGYFMTGGILFVDRAGKRVLLLNWQGTQVVTPPPETLSLFSEHLFQQMPITQVTYSSSPVMRLWFLRSDGSVVCCEYDDQYQVKAWWRFVTGYNGVIDPVLSIVSGPGATEDLFYMAVQRGSFVTLEVLGSPYWNPTYYSGSYNSALVTPPILLDCSVLYQNLTPFTQVTTTNAPGLVNLAGRTVAVWGDGAYLGTVAYTSGTLTLPNSASCKSVVIGLPYTSLFTSMPFDLGSMEDTTRGHMQSIPRVDITFLNSLDATIATVNSNFGLGGSSYGPAQMNKKQTAFPTLFTGTEREPVTSGYGADSSLSIKSSIPLPCTVTAIMPMVGDRERA